MQQKIVDGMILVRASKEESGSIRALRMMRFDKEAGFWYGEISRTLLEKLQQIAGLIPPAKRELIRMRELQQAVDRERMKPDADVSQMAEMPIKAKPYKHQIRAFNMALMTFGLINPEKEETNGAREMLV